MNEQQEYAMVLCLVLGWWFLIPFAVVIMLWDWVRYKMTGVHWTERGTSYKNP